MTTAHGDSHHHYVTYKNNVLDTIAKDNNKNNH